MKKLLILTFALAFIVNSFACTTAVISGEYTSDGRPMIWKLRDTDYLKNKMMYFEDGLFNYVGLVNSEDIKGEQVWGGANSEGFSIMNSASFNVNLNDTTSFKDQEGFIIKKALQECATLEDFEKLLDKLAKPMGLAAHFGVIDAKGGAAFYEVNNYTYTKFDANDPTEAPNGYILRTNFSFTGKKDVGYGFIRFQTAQDIFYEADAEGKLNHQTIIQDFSRCFKHSVLDKDYRAIYSDKPEGEDFINSGDLITRHGSSSSILIQGAKPGVVDDIATIWIQVGFPNTCMVLPVWVEGGSNLPKALQADASGNAPLNEMALKLKEQCYPIKRSSGFKYLQISKLFNSEKTGMVQEIEKAENEIFIKTAQQIKDWKHSKNKTKAIQGYYKWLDEYVLKSYKEAFGLEY